MESHRRINWQVLPRHDIREHDFCGEGAPRDYGRDGYLPREYSGDRHRPAELLVAIVGSALLLWEILPVDTMRCESERTDLAVDAFAFCLI